MRTPLRLLLVEDDENDAQLVLRHLRKGGYDPQWVRVDTPDGMIHAIEAQSWDVVISDYAMPHFDALAALGIARQKAGDIPFIIVSGTIGEHTAVAAMKAGAHDYLMKDRLDRLPSVVGKEMRDAQLRRDHEQATAELRSVSTRLELALRSAHAGTWDWDLATDQVIWSPQMSELHGLDPASTVPSFASWRPVVHPEDLEPAEQAIRRAALEASTLFYDYRVVLPGGAIRWINVRGEGLRDEQGRPSRLLGICLDVTERKTLEHHIRERVKELRAFYHLVELAGREDMDLDGVYQALVNLLPQSWQYPDVTCARIVIGDQEFRSHNFAESPWQQTAVVSVDGSVLGRLDVGYLEEKPEEDEGPFVKEEQQLIDAMAKRIGEITRRKRAEQALQTASERLAAATRAGNIGVWDWNVARDELFWDDAMYTLYGIRREDFSGAYAAWASAIHPEDKERTEGEIMAALRGEREYAPEFRIVWPDGSVRHLQASSRTFRTPDGKPIRMVGVNIDVTEQKRSERETVESRQLLASIVDSAPLMIFLKEARDLRLTLLNRAGEEILGLSRDEVLGKSDFDLFPPEHAAFFRAKDLEALASDGIVDIPEEPITTAHRGERLFHTRKVRVTGSDGSAKYVLGIAVDITDRTQAEEALRESEHRYRTLFDASPFGVVLIGPDGRILEANVAQARLFGHESPTGLAGVSAVDLVAPSSREYSREVQGRRLADRDNPVVQYELIRKDGTTFPGEVSASLLRDTDGRVVGYICVTRDLSEQFRAEQALRASEERFQLGMEATSDGLWDWNAQTDEVYYSPACYRMLGYDVGAFPGTLEAWQKLLHPDDVAHTMRVNMDCVEGRTESFRVEYRLRGANGEWRWILGRGKCISRDEQGRALRLVGTNLDITDRKRAERERAELEEQLRQSQKLEAIGSLAGGVAHDFNNLLSVIQCYTGFAMDGLQAGDPRRDDLEEVKQAATRAESLTRQLLAFSRKQVLQPVVLDLNEVVRGVEKMLRRLIGENVELVEALAPELGPTLADPGQVEQVLMNLVVNARDAMPTGGRCTIATSNVEVDRRQAARLGGLKPGSYVRLAVTDTGTGMDDATQARVFEPFFTTKEKGKGTGLGLSTVYGIVKQSGGHVELESEVGRGTTFTILLPRDDGSAEAVGPDAAKAGEGGRGAETVLVVDDEEPLRKAAARSLEAAGYTVLQAANGEEALTVLGQHAGEVHLVLTDVVMPKMGGKELAVRLAELRPAAKVLFMSGYTDDAVSPYGVLDPGIRLIHKPFRSVDLVQTVREALGGTPTPAPTGTA